MPNSRKRHTHHNTHPSHALPAKQSTKGRIIWALLVGVFGLLIGLFASGDGYVAPLIGGLLGLAVGYLIGKNMEKEL